MAMESASIRPAPKNVSKLSNQLSPKTSHISGSSL